jgi:hypothetical protein
MVMFVVPEGMKMVAQVAYVEITAATRIADTRYAAILSRISSSAVQK